MEEAPLTETLVLLWSEGHDLKPTGTHVLEKAFGISPRHGNPVEHLQEANVTWPQLPEDVMRDWGVVQVYGQTVVTAGEVAAQMVTKLPPESPELESGALSNEIVERWGTRKVENLGSVVPKRRV